MDARMLFDALSEMWDAGHIENAPRSYSGRGMYGAVCVGVTLSDSSDIFKVGVLLGSLLAGQDEFDPCNLPRCSTDSMGLGAILYWPSVEWLDTFEERD